MTKYTLLILICIEEITINTNINKEITINTNINSYLYKYNFYKFSNLSEITYFNLLYNTLLNNIFSISKYSINNFQMRLIFVILLYLFDDTIV